MLAFNLSILFCLFLPFFGSKHFNYTNKTADIQHLPHLIVSWFTFIQPQTNQRVALCALWLHRLVGMALISWKTGNPESAPKEVVNMTVCQLFPSNASVTTYTESHPGLDFNLSIVAEQASYGHHPTIGHYSFSW